MKVKKNSVVTVRLPDDLLLEISHLAEKRDWTISHTVFRLVQSGLILYQYYDLHPDQEVSE